MIFNTGGGGNATRIVTGKNLHLADTAGGKYKNIKLVGASVQNGTPAVSKPVDIVSNKVKSITGCGKNLLDCNGLTQQTISGVTFTPVYKDGLLKYVNVNGTNTSSNVSQYFLNQALSFNDNEKYTLNGCPSGGSGTTFKLDCFYSGSSAFNDTGNGVTFTARKGEILKFRIVVFGGATLNNVKFYPMLRLASITDDTYEPYTANTAELDETYELNGINGIYDEIDLERGVRIQRFGVQVFNGSEVWTRENDSATFTRFIIDLDNIPHGNANERLGCFLCTHGAFSGITSTSGAFVYNMNNAKGRFFIYANFNTTLSEWQSGLASNPMTVVYELETPVETPLSVDELIAFNKLRAYKSGSTLFSGCDMEVEYFLNNKVGQPMADTHLNTAKYILDGATLNIIV